MAIRIRQAFRTFSGIIFVAVFILFTLVQIEYIESDLLSMNIIARLNNHSNIHSVTVETNGVMRELSIPVKRIGFRLGGERWWLLCLALATYFCNDLYREALKKGLRSGTLELRLRLSLARLEHPDIISGIQLKWKEMLHPKKIEALIRYTDTVSEIQNTLRHGASVVLTI